MKNILSITFALVLGSCLLSSCFKDYDERYRYTNPTIEFENAVSLSKAAGKNYPVLPAKQKPGVERYRVNYFGGLPAEDLTLSFHVVDGETTAKEGVDYNFPNGKTFTVKKGESFGYVEVEALDGLTNNTLLVIALDGNSQVKTADLYKTIGINFSLP